MNAIKFYERRFKSDESFKKAYLKCCKWLAINIVGKVEVGETFYKITKVEDADLPTFKVELYCVLDTKEIGEKYCKKCKEMHRSFFINQDYNCSACRMKSYVSMLEQRLTIKKGYRKERLSYVLKKE